MQFTAQHGYYATNFPKAEFAIVELDGRPVGRFYVDRSEHEFRVIDIALLPDFRAHDIGTRLLRDLIAEASAVGRAITLHVERFNPARDWYERLGFASVDTHGIYVLMRREPHHHEKIA
jgi:ribosomal protein S18 acetylase RimI-like enzyme